VVVDAVIALGGSWLVEAARRVERGRPCGQPGRPRGLGCSPFPLPPRGARQLDLAMVVGSGNGSPATVVVHADGGARERRICP
jgi:hypothetical protein